MCPSAPDCLRLDIDAESTDEEVVLFLGSRRDGDPVPLNVITDVNPFSIDPRNSPEGIWFLYSSKVSQSQTEGDMIKATNGYWKSMDNSRILTSTPTVGRKATREFYTGQEPYGDRTAWRMQEYWAEQISNKLQDNSALCRFFLQHDERLDDGEQVDPVIPGDADGESIDSMLLSLLEQEERIFDLRDAAGSQIVGEDDQRQLESSSRPLQQELENGNSMEDMQAGYDFSKEDFLELKDLYDPISSSSSSDNSSLMSMNSDEYFDAEALSRDIENERSLGMEEHVDIRLNVTTPTQSNQVVVQPPPPPAIGNSMTVSDGSTNSSPTAASPYLPASNLGPQSDSETSTSGSSQGSQGSSSHSGGSGSTSRTSGSKSVRRMAKLSKRYCCFGSSEP